MSTTTVPGKYVSTLIRALLQRGLNPTHLFAQCGLPIDKCGEYDIPEQVSSELYTRVYKTYLTLMHDEHFAFSSESGNTPGKYRMLCLTLAQCPDLGSGLKRARDFYRSFGTAAGSFELVHMDNETVLRLTGAPQVPAHLAASVAANLLISIKRTLDHLVGMRLAVLRISLRGAAGSHPRRYADLFGSPVDFGADHNAICFEGDISSYPIVHTAQSIEDIFEQMPGILFRDIDDTKEGLRARIITLLGHDLSRPWPRQTEIAQRLGMPPHRLRQQLASEHSSYRQLKRELQQQRACELLRETELSVAEISDRLGFPAATALHRAFRNWTGMTPLQYRQTQTR